MGAPPRLIIAAGAVIDWGGLGVPPTGAEASGPDTQSLTGETPEPRPARAADFISGHTPRAISKEILVLQTAAPLLGHASALCAYRVANTMQIGAGTLITPLV